jgi:hypothetical protein
MGVSKDNFDPSIFNDPIAIKSSWIPINYAGASLSTHNLKLINTDRMEIKERTGSKLFKWFALIFAIIIFIYGIQDGSLLTIALGFGFSLAILLSKGANPETVIFDKKKGHVTLTSKRIIGDKEISEVALNRVYAIQILPVHHSDTDVDDFDSDDYYSFETNIILDDGERISLVNQGNYEIVELQAEQLSRFLKVPVWKKP